MTRRQGIDQCDVAVIGSGFGGAIAAFRYAAAGLKVIVLERGERIADADLRQSQAPDDLFRVYTRYQSTFIGGGGDTGLDVLTGTVVGGGSIVYSGASLRAPSFVFARTDRDGKALWPAGTTRADLDPHYATVEANLPVTQLVWRTDDDAEAWRQVPRRGSAWAKVMKAAGHTVLPLRQAVDGCTHCGWCNAGCRFGHKRDLTKSYLPAAERLGATIRSGVEVQHLSRVADGWQVLGTARTGPGPLDVGPEVTLVQASHVVISAGTVASTLLLQRSGIGSPHLGRHVSGNADLPIAAFLNEPTDGYQGVAMDTVSFDFLRSETSGPHAADKFIVISQHMLPLSTLVCDDATEGTPDAWGLARKHRYADFGRHFVGLAVIGLDQQEGTIEGPEVHASDGVRLLPLRYPVAPETQAVWDRAKQVCRDAVEGAGGTFVDLARELANPQTAHPLGGARMAADPADGVVDPDGFVHGHDGLSVLDGAIVPSALGVNPSLTIAALVERAMTSRVTALGRPDAASLRPAEVLTGDPVPVPAPTRSKPAEPSPDALPATGGGADLAAVGALAASRRRRWPRRAPRSSAARRRGCRRHGHAPDLGVSHTASSHTATSSKCDPEEPVTMTDDTPLAKPAVVPNRWRARLVIAVAAVGLVALAAPVRALEDPPQPEPYRDPPFTCEVHDYGTEAPTLPAPEDDPLCVRYDKTNITVSTLEVVDFLAAEPGRIGLVAGKCAYWQQDHWIVRVTPEDPAAIVEWEGSYWYDARTGSAGGILRNLRVGGQPADGAAFAEALRPLIGDEAADDLASFAAEGGGGGATFQLPEGFAYPDCAFPGSGPADPPPSDPAPAPSAPDAPSPESPPASVASELPRTGGPPAHGLALALATLAIGIATRRLQGLAT